MATSLHFEDLLTQVNPADDYSLSQVPLTPYKLQCQLKRDSKLRQQVFDDMLTNVAFDELVHKIQQTVASITYEQQLLLERQQEARLDQEYEEARIRLLRVWAEADRKSASPEDKGELEAIEARLKALSEQLAANALAFQVAHEAWFQTFYEVGQNVITKLAEKFGAVSDDGKMKLTFDLGEKYGTRTVQLDEEKIRGLMSAFRPLPYAHLQKVHPDLNLVKAADEDPRFAQNVVAMNHAFSQICACSQLGGNREEDRLTGGALLSMIKLAQRAVLASEEDKQKQKEQIDQQVGMVKNEVRLCKNKKAIRKEADKDDVQLRRVRAKRAETTPQPSGPTQSSQG